ncbi:MAG: S26 family signal peptidase [Hyphomonadaceae bacterium]
MGRIGKGVQRWGWLLAAAFGGALLFVQAPALVIYNGSQSVPTGFYLRSQDPITMGAFVTLRAADASAAYAHERGFDGAEDRFIKRVAAGAGARICASGDTVILGDGRELTRLERDAAGRRLPAWSGCRTLGADEVFLLGDTPDSFDSRYWGPVRRDRIDGVWRPLR